MKGLYRTAIISNFSKNILDILSEKKKQNFSLLLPFLEIVGQVYIEWRTERLNQQTGNRGNNKSEIPKGRHT